MNTTNTAPQVSDWPEAYVDDAIEGTCGEYGRSEPEELADWLAAEHGEMRFGSVIDLNIQQGFYLHRGNGMVTKAQGSDWGYVIGALEGLLINVTAAGNVSYWANEEVENGYGITRGTEKLEWALAHATGPWFLTADYREKRSTDWYWLTLRFLNDDDESTFRAAFPDVTQ